MNRVEKGAQMRRLAVLTGVTALLAAPTVSMAQWEPPQCDLSTGHFLVNSAVLYLKAASESDFEDQEERELNNARRVLNQALDRGQADNPAVWYLWGRYYEMNNDPIGADSTYSRAVEMQPDCEEDVDARRYRMWVPLVNAGIEAYQAGESQTALEQFRKANAIYRKAPEAFFYMADIMGRMMNEPDSAVHYFKRVLEIVDADDEEKADMYRNSTYMVARLYHIDQQLDSAAAWYRNYLELDPTDGEVISSLASVLNSLGRDEEALELYDSVLEMEENLSSFDLFSAGVALFIAEDYQRAAEAFEAGLEKNPYYRDGLYNLANAYVALGQARADSLEGEELVQANSDLAGELRGVAETLVEVDPYSQDGYRILAETWRLQGEPDSTLTVLERADTLEFEVSVDLFQELRPNVWGFQGVIENRKEREVQVPDITFEFVNEAGEVMTTETFEAQALAPGEVATFEYAVENPDIAAWRYDVGNDQEMTDDG